MVASAAPTVKSSKAVSNTSVGVSRSKTDTSGGKEFYVSATAYTADCNGCSGITATGINLRTIRI